MAANGSLSARSLIEANTYIHEKNQLEEIYKKYRTNQYTSSQISEGIETREGEIQEVIKATEELAIPKDKEENIKKEGQTQADE